METKTQGYGTIGWAVSSLQYGHKVCRAGWNGKNMWLELQKPDEQSKMTMPYVYMKTADDQLVPWLCSQTDLLAHDWVMVDPVLPGEYHVGGS